MRYEADMNAAEREVARCSVHYAEVLSSGFKWNLEMMTE